jgi:hypothetical protein
MTFLIALPEALGRDVTTDRVPTTARHICVTMAV